MMRTLICLLMGLLFLAGCAARPKLAEPSAPAADIQPVAEEEAAYVKISAADAKKMMDAQSVIILDVRTPEEYQEGHIENALLLPVDTILKDAEKTLTDKTATLLVYCRSGNRSKTASEALIKLGYQQVYDFGGINSWPYDVVK